MINIIIISCLIGIVLSLTLGVVYIDFLKKKMYKQYVRDDIPQNHEAKNGTPTTGGVFFVLSSILASIAALFMAEKTSTAALMVLLAFLFYTFAGFMDDKSKISQKQNAGLTPRGKLFFQFAIALLPSVYMLLTKSTAIHFGSFNFDLGFFYPLFAVFLIVGTSNAVNLTDGLDGLAASNSIISLIAFTILLIFTGQLDLAIVSAAIAGAVLGFLFFNKYPAQVFMGDTGSLALGGVIGSIAVVGKLELWLLFLGIVFFLETLSVMIQVTSFRLTGKRVFKMSPIHHHFELCGWKETKIVAVFSFVTLLFSVLAIILFKFITFGG